MPPSERVRSFGITAPVISWMRWRPSPGRHISGRLEPTTTATLAVNCTLRPATYAVWSAHDIALLSPLPEAPPALTVRDSNGVSGSMSLILSMVGLAPLGPVGGDLGFVRRDFLEDEFA